MTEVGAVERYLSNIAPQAMCDICLSQRIGLPVEIIRAQAEECAREGWCERKIARCSQCRSKRDSSHDGFSWMTRGRVPDNTVDKSA